MARRAQRIKPRRVSTPPNPLAQLTFYAVVTIAALVGSMSYSSGASIEGALGRAAMVLLVCTLAGYAINVVLILNDQSQRPQPVLAPALVGLSGPVTDSPVLESRSEIVIEQDAGSRVE